MNSSLKSNGKNSTEFIIINDEQTKDGKLINIM